MTDQISALLAEYDLRMKGLALNQSGRIWEQDARRAIYTCARAAGILAGLSRESVKECLKGSVDDLNRISSLVACHKEIDPEWVDRAWLIGWVAVKTLGEFRSRLWSAATRLFHGGRDANFITGFTRVIDQQLTEAWFAGSKEMGVEQDEMTAPDFHILETIINNEDDFILRMADDIDEARMAGMEADRFEREFGHRVDMWANRYRDTVNRARVYFGNQERMEWRIGPTEEHCATCPRLNGIVAFGREWQASGFQPQHPPNGMLECGGWGCQCGVYPTNKRRTPRALDRLTQIAVGG